MYQCSSNSTEACLPVQQTCLPSTDGMPCLQVPQAPCMYTQWHALLRHCTSHCIFLLPVCNVTCFVAPLNISLCLFAACLRRYRLCSPVHQLQIGTALAATHVAVAGSTIVPAYCAASHLPTLAAMCYCLLTLVFSHVTDYCHWVQDFRLSPKP